MIRRRPTGARYHRVHDRTPGPLRLAPEPELIGYGDATARAAMERLGADTWAGPLVLPVDQGGPNERGDPAPARDAPCLVLRAAGGPAPAPASPTPIAAVLAEFRDRLAGDI